MCEIRRISFPCCRRQKWHYTKLPGICMSMVPSMRCPPMLCMFIGGKVLALEGGKCDDCAAEAAIGSTLGNIGGKRGCAVGDSLSEDNNATGGRRDAKKVHFDIDPSLPCLRDNEGAQAQDILAQQTTAEESLMNELLWPEMSPKTKADFDAIDWNFFASWDLASNEDQTVGTYPAPAGENL